jgi:tetratricopeptide (TPR) repeat protein
METVIGDAAAAVRAGRLAEAGGLLRRALAVEPAHVAVANSMAAVLILDGALDAADVVLARALAVHPQEPALWVNRTVQALRSGDMTLACRWARAVLCLSPASLEGHLYLGRAIDRDHPGAAAIAFGRVLAINPYVADAHAGLCKVRLDGDDLAAAVRSARAVLTLEPGTAAALANLAVAAWGLGWRKIARLSARRALAIDRSTAPAAWILAQALLAEGDFLGGLPLLESRWALTEFRADNRSRSSAPEWDGAIRPGLRLLLWAEQGYGDALQFIRYAPLLARRGVALSIEVRPALYELFAMLGGRVIRQGERLPAVDAQAALMSLPHLMGTTLATIPAEGPYLRAPEARRRAWRERLQDRPRPLVGLCWQGNPAYRRDRERSPGFAPLRPLLAIPGIAFVGLVPEPGAEALAEKRLTQLGPAFADFADTAACLEELDLVVTSDTALAHLAGALGRPTLLLLHHHVPDWRWLEGRSDSPWYPSMRLYRQPAPGDWAAAVAALEQDLVGRLKP